jgi:S1-C subfamily serine protease
MKNLSLTLCLAIAALFGSVGVGIALPDCPSDPSDSWHNCFGIYIDEDGGRYVGDWSNNDKHGQGDYTWEKSGDKYFGGWRNGKRHGRGTFIFGSNSEWAGDKYVGEYKDDKFNGQGTYTYATGDNYVGEFKDGKFNGEGIKTYLDGTVEEGIWKDWEFAYAKKLSPSVSVANDLPPCIESAKVWNDCFGAHTDEIGNFFGEWQNNKRNGHGMIIYSNGDKYVGEFRDDNFNGQGTYTWTSGDKYVGEYKDGKQNGQGTYTYADGRKEQGIWTDDEIQGAKKLSPSVPVTKTPTQDEEIISASSGSGFAVSSDGYVITNHHVIEGCQEVVVHIKGKELPVTVVTYDPQNDLALLKGDFRPKTVFPLSNNRPELLQDIYVAGFPFGDKFSTSVKVTKGIISSLTGLGNNFSNIQIDAALQSGNSGGPILDDFGNVIGVAVSKLDAKYMFEEFGIIPENTNFGIKSSVVRSVLDSNEVDSPPANQSEISKSKLGKMISSGTYYISCWMTMAQIEKMKTKKVFFSNLD